MAGNLKTIIKNLMASGKSQDEIAEMIEEKTTPRKQERQLSDKETYTIVAKQNTFLKRSSGMATDLSPEDKILVVPGKDYTVEFVSYDSPHLKLRMSNDDQSWFVFMPHWEIPDDLNLRSRKNATASIAIETANIVKSSVKKHNVSQPDPYTCQSACVAMAIGDSDVYRIRKALESRGVAGDPAVMSWYLNRKLNDPLAGNRHIFDDNASMSEMREWLRNGEFLITYGWFTGSGHVVGIDGISIDTSTMSYKFDMADPWSEFDFQEWAYNNPSIKFFNGYYSPLGIYAACVASSSVDHAAQIYRAGSFDSNHKGAWVHRILPK